jgi:Tetratricopeptide repeat
MPGADQVMERIGEAIALQQRGDQGEAARRFAELWEQIGPDGDPLHRCAVAHYMADAQDDPGEELRWDLRALEAADSLTEERAAAYHPALAVGGFYPSLHLNLAEDYRKLGRLEEAHAHLTSARAAVAELPDDGYGSFVRGGIERLADRLAGQA